MNHERPSTTHEERTADQVRSESTIDVRASKIDRVNKDIRTIELEAVRQKQAIKFLPGQWLDVFCPGLDRAGGFTITSTPRSGQTGRPKPPFLQLAVQNTRNPPAKWLWKPEAEILDQRLRVRVGGNFTWPPPHIATHGITRLVLVAGGVGINPLYSILCHLTENKFEHLEQIVFLYSTKAGDRPIHGREILFLPTLSAIAGTAKSAKVQLRLFLTHVTDQELREADSLPELTEARRINTDDLDAALGEVDGRKGTICYVCGPPQMTDSFVEQLSNAQGMHADRVLCEKWW